MAALAPVARAQRTDTTRAARPDSARLAITRAAAARPDSALKPPISPRRALFYSFAVPGLGQSQLRRRKTAAGFVIAEVTFALLAQRTADRIAEAKAAPDSIRSMTLEDPRTGGVRLRYEAVPNYLHGRLQGRRSQYEDWIALLITNHLMAGAEAFISAQLWDLPAQVSTRRVMPVVTPLAAPGVRRRIGVGVRWGTP